MNINEILAQINALHWAATQGEWQIDQDSVSEWSMYGGGGLISDAWQQEDAEYIAALHNAWPAISAELGRLQEELRMAVFGKKLLEESFEMAMAEVDHQRAVIEKAREALTANHQWHQDYDDYGGYPGSDLCQMNEQALAALNKPESTRGEETK